MPRPKDNPPSTQSPNHPSNLPRWKYYLSYLVEFHIESAPSEINPHLYVSLKRGRYQLSTANAVYSFADLYTNFRIAFEKIKLDQRTIQDVLVLGFGLGSIPYLLEKTFKKKYRYTAVEIDENVLYLANKYVLGDLSSPISIMPTDAAIFVSYCQEQFDLICMDVFLDDEIPTYFESEDYLIQLKNLLTQDGLLLFNKLALTEKDKENCKAFLPVFQKIFPDATYFDVDGNWIFVSSSC